MNCFFKERILFFSIQVIAMIIFLICVFTALKWGPIVSSDTLSYFNLANKVVDGHFPYSNSYSPGYPCLIGILGKYFNSNFQTISFFVSIFVFLSSIYIWFCILRRTIGAIFPSIFLFFLSVVFTNFWWSIKIINFAHADSFFYFFILLISFQILLWIERPTILRFIFISILASISIWIKYNGLIFLPILLILILIKKDLNQRTLYGIFSVVFILYSFFLFKMINNGEVINHLETNRSFVLWQGDSSVETFLINIKDAGSVFIQYFISNFYRNFSNYIFDFFSTFSLLALVLVFFTKRNQNFIGFVFYIFFVTYIMGYMIMAHFTNHTEIDQRTMFPAYIFFTISLLSIFSNLSFIYKLVLVLFLFFNISRSLLGFKDWFMRASMDSFNKIEDFKKKNSLNFLKDIMDQKGILPDMVYTNNFRYLTASFDYQFVKMIPNKSQFVRGKFREKSEKQLYIEIEDLRNNLVLGKAIIVLFDFEGEIEILKGLDGLKIISMDNDLIIYSE